MEEKTSTNRETGNKKKQRRPNTYRLAFGYRSLELCASGEKTSTLVPVSQYPWIVRVRPGLFILACHYAHRWTATPEGKMTVVGVCSHANLDEVRTCGSHHPEQINPNRPNWESVLGSARTFGRQTAVPMSERKQLKNAASPWVVVDFTYEPTRITT